MIKEPNKPMEQDENNITDNFIGEVSETQTSNYVGPTAISMQDCEIPRIKIAQTNTVDLPDGVTPGHFFESFQNEDLGDTIELDFKKSFKTFVGFDEKRKFVRNISEEDFNLLPYVKGKGFFKDGVTYIKTFNYDVLFAGEEYSFLLSGSQLKAGFKINTLMLKHKSKIRLKIDKEKNDFGSWFAIKTVEAIEAAE